MTGRIFVAAGHHPKAPGAGFEGFYEHDEAARWLAEMAKVTPSSEVEFVPSGILADKTTWINARAQPGDIAVELHFNASADRAGDGSVSLYKPGSDASELLAEHVQAAMASVLPPSRGAVPGWYRGDESRGPYKFLQDTRCPAIIVQPEFVHHRELIQSKRAEACVALLSSLTKFVGLRARLEK